MHKKLNRHQRRNRSKVVPGGSSLSTTSANSPLTIVKSNTRNACVFRPVLQQRGGSSTIHARIASGMGPDGLAEARKMRKNRRMMVRVMAIAILSMIVALAKKYYYSGEQQLPRPSSLLSRDHSQDTQSTVNVIIEDTVPNDDGLLIDKEEALIVEGIRTEDNLQEKCDSEVESEISTKSTDESKVDIPEKNEFDVCVNDEVSSLFIYQA